MRLIYNAENYFEINIIFEIQIVNYSLQNLPENVL